MLWKFYCVWEATSHQENTNQALWQNAVLGLDDFGKSRAHSAHGHFAGLDWLSLTLDSAPDEIPPALLRETQSRWSRQLAAGLSGQHDVAVSVLTGDLAESGPRLLVLDADSTLFDCEVIERVAAHAGTETQVAAITAAAMRGELDFASSLQQRMATLAGLPAAVLDEVRQSVNFHPGAVELVTALHKHGARVGVVSGGFAEVVGPKADEIGIDYQVANHFEIQDGVLTGRPQGEIVTSEIKVRSLRKWAQDLKTHPANCVAMGDGANDIPMMQAAGLGIAFCAKPVVRETADVRIPFKNLAAAAILSGCVTS